MQLERRQRVELSPLEQLRTDLLGMEIAAQNDLTTALAQRGEPTGDAVRTYLAFLEREKTTQKSANIAHALVDTIQAANADIKLNGLGNVARKQAHNLLDKGVSIPRAVFATWPGRITVGSATLAALAESIAHNADLTEGFRLFLNGLVRWSNSNISQLDPLTLLTGFAGATATISISAGVTSLVVNLENRRQEARLEKQRVRLETFANAQKAIREGTADLNLLVDEHVACFVGKQDFTAPILKDIFHEIGLEMVTYWDEENKLAGEKGFWIRTNNQWIDAAVLKRGAIQKAVALLAQVTSSQDGFLSRRKFDSVQPEEDMMPQEVLDSVQVIRSITDSPKSVPPVIAVMNPKREGSGAIAGVDEDKNPYGAIVTVQDRVNFTNRDKEIIYLLDPDTFITSDIAIAAQKAAGENNPPLPIELRTNKERQTEYEQLMRTVIREHNQREEEKAPEVTGAPQIRYRTEEDGMNTLTVIFGKDDTDTYELAGEYLAKIDSILRANPNAQVGDFFLVVNDPSTFNQMREEIKSKHKYTCYGEVMAAVQLNKFVELVASRSIKLQDRIIRNIVEFAKTDKAKERLPDQVIQNMLALNQLVAPPSSAVY